MVYIEFPVTGPLRQPLIIMEWILIFMCLELGLIYILKYKQSPKSNRNFQELSYATLFFSFGMQWIWFIFSDFYAPDADVRMIFLTLGYLTLIIGALIFIFSIERTKVFFKKYLFTYIFVIVVIGMIILVFIDISLTQSFSYIPSPFFVLFFFMYVVDFARKSHLKGTVFENFIKFFFGFALLAVGYMLTTDVATGTFGLETRLYGDIIQIIAIIIIYVFFLTLPPFSEFDWYDKIESLFLIHRSGIKLFSKHFGANVDEEKDAIISAALTSVHLMLGQLTQKEGISIVKKEETTAIIYPGTYITGVIFCKVDLISLKSLLVRFVDKVEVVYSGILSTWSGEHKAFDPVANICDSVFKKI